MSDYKCRMCGSAMDIPLGAATVKCPGCGTVQAVLRSDEDTFDLGGKQPAGATGNNKKLMSFFAAAVLLLAIGMLSWNAATTSSGGQNADEPAQGMRRIRTPQSAGPVGGVLTKASYEELATQGDVEAQFALAEMYFSGEGTERNVAQAAKWYREAAEQGHVRAQCKMGAAYYNGWGVEKDYRNARKWYQKAAAREDAEAQVALGNMYYNGTGMARNYSNAVWWYGQAAAQGHAWGQYYLGNMYRNGLGVEKDLDRARDLYQKATEQGHIAAMAALESVKRMK